MRVISTSHSRIGFQIVVQSLRTVSDARLAAVAKQLREPWEVPSDCEYVGADRDPSRGQYQLNYKRKELTDA